MNVRIERAKIWEVVVPPRAGAVDSVTMASPTSVWPELPICLIELTFSDGIVGLGEVTRGVDLACVLPFVRQMIGRTPHGPSASILPPEWRRGSAWGLIEAFPTPLWDANAVAAAVQMALLDWTGKRTGCSVVDLLGGACRQEVPVDYWCGRQTPADLARVVARARDLGFSGLKMKSQLGDPVVEQMRAIRANGGDHFRVTIDPMFQWLNPQSVLGMIKHLEPYADVLRIEDPFPQDQPGYWHRLRDSVAIPLVWHARGIDSLRRGLQERCADAFNCGGGILEFLTLANAVEVAGQPCWHGSGIELGVAQVAHLHAAAAARSCVLPSDFVSGLVREHTLITWDWPYRNGAIGLPQGAGLGIELDHESVRRFQRHFAEVSV